MWVRIFFWKSFEYPVLNLCLTNLVLSWNHVQFFLIHSGRIPLYKQMLFLLHRLYHPSRLNRSSLLSSTGEISFGHSASRVCNHWYRNVNFWRAQKWLVNLQLPLSVTKWFIKSILVVISCIGTVRFYLHLLILFILIVTDRQSFRITWTLYPVFWKLCCSEKIMSKHR